MWYKKGKVSTVGAFGSNDEFIFRDVCWNAKCELNLAGLEQVLFTFLFADSVGLRFSLKEANFKPRSDYWLLVHGAD